MSNQTADQLDPDATYIRIRDTMRDDTEEVEGGIVFFDRDAEGNLLGIDVLVPCEIEKR